MLFNEPKLLKRQITARPANNERGFSALQRAEIAEIAVPLDQPSSGAICFSALQRAEIAESASSAPRAP